MPLTDAGNKVRNAMHEEYGEKEGDKVFYSKENGDKKFRKLVTGNSKRKAVWWASRLNKLPVQMKMKLIGTLKANKSLSWWINRLDTFQTHCGGNHVAKAEHEGHLVTKDGNKHLPTHSNGKPNHRLMGAAWAALHGGYRGNKYEGPDKQTAISKLKRLYRKEGLTPPSEK